jgi:beta-lactamase regulating signal transducer with metallopeptidase domain
VNAAPSLAVWLHCLGLLALGSGALIALATLLGRAARTAHWQRTLWRAVFAGLAVLIVAEAVGGTNWLAFQLSLVSKLCLETPSAKLRFAPQPPVGREAELPAVRPQAELGHEKESATSEADAIEPGSAEPDLWHKPGVSWPGVLWLAGTLALAIRGVVGRVLLIVFRRRHPPSADAALKERVRSVAARLSLWRSVAVVQAPGLCGPVAFGILRPTIAVPADFTTTFDAPRQEVMLAHELAHLAARDPAWLLLADFVAAVLWWQPLVWWSRRQLRAAGETAADEASVVVADGPGLLAACLVELGTRIASPGRAGWVRMAGPGFRSSLGRRVEHLLQMPNQTWRPTGGTRSRMILSLAVVALLICAVLSTAWARPQAWQEGDEPMQTVQRSWRHSLAGAFLLAALAPTNDAVPAGEPPQSTEKAAGEPRRSREYADEWDRVSNMLVEVNEQLSNLQRADLPNEESPLSKKIKAQIAELEAKKRELEAELKMLPAKRIRVFRLKHVKPEEVRQALESLLGASTGAMMGGGMPPMGGRGMMGGAGMPGPGGMPAGGMKGGGMMGAGAGMPGMQPAMFDMKGLPLGWRLTIDERTQSIIMRGSRRDLQRVADLIALLDQPGGKAIPKVKNLQAFKLKYAKAEKLAEILDQLDLDARVLPLTQSNRLIVTGSDAALKEVADLIEQLDVEANGSK